MVKTKLQELLFSFSKGSLEELMDFARLPSLNLREWHLNVLDYFCELRIKRNIKEEKYQKEYIINEVFSDVPEIKKDWYDINSKLVEIINRFILYRNADPKTPSAAIDLARYYFDNKLKKCFEAQRDNINKYFEVSKNRTFNVYFKKYDFLNLELVNNISIKGNSNVRLSIDVLDKGYLENRLWLMCEELTRKKEWHGTFESDSPKNIFPKHGELIFEAIWSVIKDTDFDDVVISYLKALYPMLLKGEINEKIILALYKKRIILFEECEKWRARTLLDYLLNLFKSELNNGNIEYATYYIELINLYDKHKALLVNQNLPTQIFKNAVTASLIADKAAWGHNFIECYKKYIEDEIIDFNIAHVYLFQGKYNEAFEILPVFAPENTAYFIGAKRLILKIFYEKKDTLAMESMIPSFRDNVKNRSDIPLQYKEKVLNFIKYLLLLQQGSFDLEKACADVAITDAIWFRRVYKKTGK